MVPSWHILPHPLRGWHRWSLVLRVGLWRLGNQRKDHCHPYSMDCRRRGVNSWDHWGTVNHVFELCMGSFTVLTRHICPNSNMADIPCSHILSGVPFRMHGRSTCATTRSFPVNGFSEETISGCSKTYGGMNGCCLVDVRNYKIIEPRSCSRCDVCRSDWWLPLKA